MIREAHEETNVTSDLWLYVATLYFTECELHVFAVSGLEYYQAISMTDEKIQKLRIKDLGITTIKPIENVPSLITLAKQSLITEFYT